MTPLTPLTPLTPGPGGRCVLVVDDDRTVRRVVRAILEADGFDVDEAADGQQALDRLAGDRAPPVVVLDGMMPKVDGVVVCRRVDRDCTRVVVLTALDDGETEMASLQAGADAFITKPFSAIALLDTVERLLA